jgi:hypothetical protein
MPAYTVVGKYLVGLLIEEIRANTTPEVFNLYNDSDVILDMFHQQFAAYTSQELPFMLIADEEPRAYWKRLIGNDNASVLAVGNT